MELVLGIVFIIVMLFGLSYITEQYDEAMYYFQKKHDEEIKKVIEEFDNNRKVHPLIDDF